MTRLTRGLWFAGGWCAVAIGSIGIVVPGLPTTVFFIVAAACFSRSSPRFEEWILRLPRIGSMVRDHREGLGMPRKAKIWALAMMWTAIVISGALLRDRLIIVVVVVVLGVLGTAYLVWRVPLRERVLAEQAAVSASA